MKVSDSYCHVNGYIEEIKKACNVMRKGGIILYPTDTVWGIGCDATNEEAVNRIFRLKERSDSKALITLIPDSRWLSRYVDDVPSIAFELIDVTTTPLTIVYDKGINLAPNLMSDDGSIGIRVTKEEVSNRLCRELRRPIVSTSANISGRPTPLSFYGIERTIIEGVDHVVNLRREETEEHQPSGILKLSKGGIIKIIR